MKNSLSIIIFLTSAFAGAQNSWTQMDSVNGPPKAVCTGFVSNGEAFLVSGLEGISFTRKMYSYNVQQNDWDNEQSMGGANGGGLSRGSACAFSLNNKGYVCLGQGDNTNFLRDCWEYDPSTDTWTQKADYMGSARRSAVAFVIGDIAYVGTGEAATGLRKDFFRYDAVNNIWGAIADFGGTARKEAVGFAMGNQGYVGTGDDGALRKDLWQYLVFQNMWIQKANFPGTPRCGAVAWAIFPNGYIATGEDAYFNYTQDVWSYNYFTDSWTACTPLTGPGRTNATAFIIDSVAYLGTGYNGNLLDDFYAYECVAGISNPETDHSFRVYPQPAMDHFTIEVNSCMFDLNAIHFYDIDGREVTSLFSVERADRELLVSVNRIKPGTYTCVMQGMNGIISAVNVLLK